MTEYIVYHQVKPGVDCSDGIVAAWVASKKFPESKLLGWVYNTSAPDFFKIGDRVRIVDFSFPKEVLEQWSKQKIYVAVIDHHQSAMNQLQGLSDRILCNFDLDECGATLTWQTFFANEKPPAFLKYVRDRDLWNWQFEETAAVHEAMSTIGRTFDNLDKLAEMSEQELLDYLLPIGQPLVEPKRKLVEEVASRFQWEDVAGYRVPLVRLKPEEERLTSEVCMYLYKKFPEAHFTACLMADGTKYSLRSNKFGNNTNVAEIAERWGGGGHRNAAGFSLS